MSDSEQTTQAKTLSAKQQLLLDLLPRFNWSFAQAGPEAGYSPEYSRHQLAKRMMGNLTFCRAYEEKKADIVAATGIDAAWCMREAAARYRACIKQRQDGAAAIDEVSAKGYLDQINRMTGAYEADNRQRQTQLGMVIM